MLKTVRVAAAVICFLAISLLFFDVTGTAVRYWGWMAKWQFVPAVLGLNLLVLAVLLGVTFLFGRVYCSVLCPLGIYQDACNAFAGFVSGKRKRRRGRFGYKRQHQKARLIFLGLFASALVLGAAGVIATSYSSILDPYGAFGRMATWIFRPGAVEINNALADVAEHNDSYAFASLSHAAIVWPVLALAIITALIVTIMSYTGGRNYCNTLCPVGTVLGMISKHSIMKLAIDTDSCTNCGSCARHCKSSCIDPKAHEIDYSRCVMCLDCVGVCREHAISLKKSKRKSQAETGTVDKERRAFLASGAILTTALASHADGGLAPLKVKKTPVREIKVVPAGAESKRRLDKLCTACQLCISNCPNNVLTPSTDTVDLMQPVMNFEKGYCRPECDICGNICPTGAILPLDLPVKASTKIGTAKVNLSACISAAYGQKCGLCSRSCPAGAITMVPSTDGKHMPVVDAEACIGCGSCEYHCPVGKTASIRAEYPAIHVEGIDIHRLI